MKPEPITLEQAIRCHEWNLPLWARIIRPWKKVGSSYLLDMYFSEDASEHNDTKRFPSDSWCGRLRVFSRKGLAVWFPFHGLVYPRLYNADWDFWYELSRKNPKTKPWGFMNCRYPEKKCR